MDFQKGLAKGEHSRLCVKDFYTKVELADKKIVPLYAGIKRFTNKVRDLGNRSRWNNLVIYGIGKCENETGEKLRERLDDMLRDKLEVKLHSIQMYHRLGRRTTNRSREIIVVLGTFCEKKDGVRKREETGVLAYSSRNTFRNGQGT